MGFAEKNPEQVRSSLNLSEDGILTSKHSNVSIQCGELEIPSLAELRSASANPNIALLPPRQLKVSEVVANVQQLHKDPINAGALFQVASQFNLLEMASPHAIPEDGVGIYGVTQAYCSALPVNYGEHPVEKWEAFARLVLEASYEATFHAAILNAASTGNNKVFLTLVGGGVFGNKEEWILDAIEKCLNMFAGYALDVNIVSYRRSQDAVLSLVKKFET
eukprot:scaffold13164_cov51-Attheya_sp.AAC.1